MDPFVSTRALAAAPRVSLLLALEKRQAKEFEKKEKKKRNSLVSKAIYGGTATYQGNSLRRSLRCGA